jgi:alkylation response protein AidB-like acyl-CoA dehydrogenase
MLKKATVHTNELEVDFATVLAGVKKVAAKAKARSAEIDEARTFPLDLLEEVEASRVLKTLLPKSFGGLGMTLAESNAVVYEAARGNGSFGWLMMVSVSQPLGNGLLPLETVRSFTTDYAYVRLRGLIAPKGIAVPVEGGYRITGRWPFATGWPNPDFVGGTCLVKEDGKLKVTPTGDPMLIMGLVPANEAVFYHETWRALGMRGTDSCDVEITDKFVPFSRVIDYQNSTTVYDMPAARLPLRVALSFPHCAVALGIAQGALDDALELAKTKRSAMNPQALLGEDPVFRHELGEQSLRLRAAKSFLDLFTAEAWNAGEEHRALTPEEILTGRLMANFITTESIKVVDWAYTRFGSSSLYDGASLQYRLRDIHVASQHASCHTDGYRNLGAVLQGIKLTPAQLF